MGEGWGKKGKGLKSRRDEGSERSPSLGIYFCKLQNGNADILKRNIRKRDGDTGLPMGRGRDEIFVPGCISTNLCLRLSSVGRRLFPNDMPQLFYFPTICTYICHVPVPEKQSFNFQVDRFWL